MYPAPPADPPDSGEDVNRQHVMTAEERAEEERAEPERLRRHAVVRRAGSAVFLPSALSLAPLAVVAARVQEAVCDTDGYGKTGAPPTSESPVLLAAADQATGRVAP
ncbi:hypothetical protein AB0D34_43345 [Streptomyces sp. NPDC048420]|uniref:hypothetical protein n=1 Tax=Streptomyces sp. NPDC048420 TaxID=3155755 RepID=UPI003431EB70